VLSSSPVGLFSFLVFAQDDAPDVPGGEERRRGGKTGEQEQRAHMAPTKFVEKMCASVSFD
jgi:hypothetical protein